MKILVGIILIFVAVVGTYVGIKNHRSEPKNKPSDWICNLEGITYIAGIPSIMSGSLCRIEVFVEKFLIEYDGLRHFVNIKDVSSYKIVSGSYIAEKVKVGKMSVEGELALYSKNKKVKFNNFIEINYKYNDQEYKAVINMFSNDDLIRITGQIDYVLNNLK